MDFAVRRQDSPPTDGSTKPLPLHVDGTAAHIVPSRYLRWSGGLNRFFALLLLLPGLPIIGLLTLVVRLTSKGPGIYRQVRVGYHGRLFDVLKIRTMREDAEQATGPVWASGKDPRITRLGFFLRLTHLDELPQLFNVVRGEMNLIGPRPERPEFTEHLAEEIPDYLQRVNIRPGVTGLAQINLPPDTDTNSVRRKLVLDLEYVQSATIGMDLRILMCTLVRLLGIRGALPARVLGLKRKPKLQSTESSAGEVSCVDEQDAPLAATELPCASSKGHVGRNGHAAMRETFQTAPSTSPSYPVSDRLASG